MRVIGTIRYSIFIHEKLINKSTSTVIEFMISEILSRDRNVEKFQELFLDILL